MDLPTRQRPDSIPKRRQPVSYCRKCDPYLVRIQAWEQPLNCQVRTSGEALFLAL